MARIRSQSEIISSLLDFFRIAQPNMDTKPGTVTRDLGVESIASQLARLYDEVSRVSTLQSLRLALGIDLDRLGSNFGVTRNAGSFSTGPALLTFSALEADFAINSGDIINARNGATFTVVNSQTISSVLSSQYKAIASANQSDLDFLGITDQFAVSILVQATAVGTQGNISKYSLSTTSIQGINNVTNVVPFGGGASVEDDNSFRNRILAIFSGANTGTALGYRNAVTADPAVIDAIVITPGDSLMTRDGTQVSVAPNGTRTIISEGTGGKVDIYVLGIRLQETIDSYIYRDLSNTGNPTDNRNDFVLGQIPGDAGKTVTRKRLDDLANKILPSQPVNNIISVSGSISGSNYVESSVDNLGRVTGNYQLLRDTGDFAGSPWGFDRLHWINNKIENFSEDKTKQIFNGQDALGFPDVLKIGSIEQNIAVTNENSTVIVSNRSIIQLSHTNVTNVTRVFNFTTGERYIVVNQNPDGGSSNTTGRIMISGKTLPAVSDILQVDYTWVFRYDPYFDFDNRLTNSNPRTVTDSVDWGFSNAVRREKATLIANGSFLTITTVHSISSVLTVNIFVVDHNIVKLSGERLAVIVSNTVNNVISITRDSDGTELWNTNKADGTFSGKTIFFPTDSSVLFQDAVTVTYNAFDVFNTNASGSFNNNTISIVPSSIAIAGTLVEVTYIANVNILLPSTPLSNLPAIRSGNNFAVNGISGIGVQPTTHIFANNVVVANLRQAPSNVVLTIAGSISPGVLTLAGTTIFGSFDVVMTVGTAGLKQDLSTLLRQALGLNSKNIIPGNVRLARIARVALVETDSALNVMKTLGEYDLKGYHLFDNFLVKSESVQDTTLSLTQFELPTTTKNLNLSPKIGDRLQVTFYYVRTSDSENISFSKSGTLYSDKKFVFIDTVGISSGFTSGSSTVATLTLSNLNQPIIRSRYRAFYDYLAPKINERITIHYNTDRLIGDATLTVENTRPINADVLVKASVPVLVDATIKIGVTTEFVNSSNIVLQNVQDSITAALNANALGTKIDNSDLVNQAYTVSGVDSARVIFFNITGKSGTVLSITANKNQFIQANNITVELDNG